MKVCGVCNKGLTHSIVTDCNIQITKCDSCKFIEEVTNVKKLPLLTIEVQDINSVPIVKLNGVEINSKQHVKYEFITKQDYITPTKKQIIYSDYREGGQSTDNKNNFN